MTSKPGFLMPKKFKFFRIMEKKYWKRNEKIIKT